MGYRVARFARCFGAFLAALTVVVVPGETTLANTPHIVSGDIVISVSDPTTTSLEIRVTSGTDDAEEEVSTGSVSLGSSDLELTTDHGEDQLVGMRFNGVSIPPGAQIGQAYVRFQVDQTSSETSDLAIRAQAADNPTGFSNTSLDVSSRATTTASVPWSPAAWTIVGESGPDQTTPDLSSVIQEVIDRPGWANGNSLVVLISGSGTRVAESFNGDAAGAPLLHVEYLQPGTSNDPPMAAFQVTCNGLTCDFIDQSTDDVAVTGWLWDFGDGSTSTTQSPTHFYSAGGTYNVSLQVNDSSGSSDSTSSDVVVTDPATNTTGVPFGPSKLPESEYAGTFNGTKLVVAPDDILSTLQNARSAGMRVFLTLVGSQSNYQNPDGTFSLDLWKANVDEFAGVDFSSYVADGTIVAHQLVEEAKAPNQWGGQVITNDVLDEMAHYSKQYWPDMLTVVRVEPTKLADDAAGDDQPWPGGWTWTYLDAAWAQYSESDGTAASYATNQQVSADLQDLGLVLGVNALDGGDGSSGEASPTLPGAWTMSATELESYGTDLMQTAQGCGFIIWRYETPGSSLENFFYFRRADIQAATSNLAAVAAASPEIPCKRAASAPEVVRARVTAASDDAEQRANGTVSLTSSDLELVVDNTKQQIVGMRFTGINVPPGATITEAHLEFRVDEVDTGFTSLTIQGQSTENATTFTATANDISSRPLTAALASWEPPPWNTVGESGPDQRSTDIAAVIQEIVDRPGWAMGNAIAIVVSGIGERTADSYEGSAADAPLLHIEYQAGSVSNEPPTANDDSASTPEDVAVTTNVIANDTDVDGNLDPASLTMDTPAANGIATSNGDGTVAYAPDPDFNGTDTYIYEVCDTGGLCDTATVTVIVDPVPDPPVANDDSANTSEDTTVNVGVSSNDTDVDGDLDSTSVTITVQGSKGSASPMGDGTVDYTPNPGATGIDSFTYEICDLTALCDSAVVTVDIGAVNNPPTANDDTVTTDEDAPVLFDAVANDTDPDDGVDRATTNTDCAGCSTPTDGSLTNHGDGTFTYDPNPDFNGPDTFIYEVCDLGGLCDTATVAVTVNPVADPPVANDDSASTSLDTPANIHVLGNDTDVENDIDPSTLQVTGAPGSGSAVVQPDDTVTYSPNAGFVGTDYFTYQICDATGLCDTALVDVTVAGVGGDPVVYVSSTSGGRVDGIRFKDEDILSFDSATGSWSMFFDGSDVGLGTGGQEVDAFYLNADGSILLSLGSDGNVPDVGLVEDHDIVRFVPTSTGEVTAGAYEMYFNGEDHDLTENGEDIDAIAFAPDGRLLVSLRGSYDVPGVSGRDVDLIAFDVLTSTWSLYLDGVAVGLDGGNTEDVAGVWVDGSGDVFMSVRGSFTVPGLSGDASDVFVCTPHDSGPISSCTFDMFWDGSANGFGGESINGIFIQR